MQFLFSYFLDLDGYQNLIYLSFFLVYYYVNPKVILNNQNYNDHVLGNKRIQRAQKPILKTVNRLLRVNLEH